jgi:peptidoglycan/LPS O-acetylase OafA/YrhL
LLLVEVQSGVDELAGVARPVGSGRAYYPALDGLRAIAFLLVFYFHYFALPWGWAGVEIFFVLSGFLITGILYDTQDDVHRFRNFYVRRTLRIFPLYWATLEVVLVIVLLIHGKVDWTFAAWPLYLGNMLGFLHPPTAGPTFGMIAAGKLANNGHLYHSTLQIEHFWSLCIEEQFYIFWPAVIFFVRRRIRLIWICAAIILICPVARLIAQSHAPMWFLQQQLLYIFMPLRVDAFAYGALLALLHRGERFPSLNKFAAIYLYLGLLLAGIYLGPHIMDAYFQRTYYYPQWEMTWGLVLVDTLSLALLVLALEPGSFIYKTLNTRSLRWLGRISYGAYVFHYIYIGADTWLINHLPMQNKLLPILFIPLVFTILLAWLSFRYFETPFIRLKNRFAN